MNGFGMTEDGELLTGMAVCIRYGAVVSEASVGTVWKDLC